MVGIAIPGQSHPSQGGGAPAKRSRWPRVGLWILTAVGALVIAVIAIRSFDSARAMPSGLVAVNGRLEGDVVRLSGRQPGRVVRLLAREGDSVHSGQLLVELEDDTLKARQASALAALEVAERRAQAAHAALLVARRELPLTQRSAQAGVHAARTAVDRAELAAAQAARDDSRGRSLLGGGAIYPQQAEDISLRRGLATMDTSAARSAERRALVALEQARLGDVRLQANEADVRVLESMVDQARAAVGEVASAIAELTLRAPVAGTVTARFVNVGEFAGAGAALLEIVDLDALYLRSYVPEPEIGRVHLGCQARVYTDSDPEHPLPAELRYIAARAEFTPKDVQTPDERVKLVYRVKLYLKENPQHRFTPGQPADAVIRFRNDVPWSRPRL